MGYTVDEEALKRTLSRHQTHTAHGSSLSRIVFAGALATLDTSASWDYFTQAQQVDLSPEDKGAAEGIHLGAMGGTLAVLQHRYLGWKIDSEVLEVKPAFPEAMHCVSISLQFRGKKMMCEVCPNSKVLSPIKYERTD